MSRSAITRTPDGVAYTAALPLDECLTAAEPLLRTAALSKWAAFPRGLSFAVSAVSLFLLVSYATELPVLYASPQYGLQYVLVFVVVCLLLLHVFLLYNLRGYSVFCYCLLHRLSLKRRLHRCFGADALCTQTIAFQNDGTIRRTPLHRLAADGPLAVLPKERILCVAVSSHFLMLLVSKTAASNTDLAVLEDLYQKRISLKDSVCIPASAFCPSDWQALLGQVKAMDVPTVQIS